MTLLAILAVFAALLVWVIVYSLDKGPLKYFFYRDLPYINTSGCFHDFTHWDDICPDQGTTNNYTKSWQDAGYVSVYVREDFILWVNKKTKFKFKQFHTHGR